MKAGEEKIEVLLQKTKTQFVIPIYQRRYEWLFEQCKELLEDIMEVAGEDSSWVHFVGSIVYVEGGAVTSSGVSKLSVVDGQQRLTTLFLIYIVLYRIAKENSNEALAEEIKENFLINKFASDSEKLKLLTDDSGMEAIRHLVNGGEKADYVGRSRVVDNFDFFRKNITNGNIDTVRTGLSKLAFVEVILDRERDNAQKIFESLNSTGLDLSQNDLIRNFILMGLSPDQQELIYKDYWHHIDKLARNEDDGKSKLSEFIRGYLIIITAQKQSETRVYRNFKSKFGSTEFAGLEAKLKPILSLSRLYNKLINPNNESDLDIRQELIYIKRLDVGVAIPFLMRVYQDYSEELISKKIFLGVLHLIQSYIIRRVIVPLPTSSLTLVFASLYSNIDKDNYLESLGRFLITRKNKSSFPRDAEISEALKHTDIYNLVSKNRSYILDKLENFNNKEPVMILNNPDITVEHIYPQNPCRLWKEQLSEEDYNLFKGKYLNTLGNLTLSGNNSSLSNREFLYKRDLEEKGYRDSRLWLNRYLANIDVWDIEALKKRVDILRDRVLSVWEYPSIVIDLKANTNNEVDLFDITEATGIRLEYFILNGTKIEEKRFSNMFAIVLQELAKMDRQLFFSQESLQASGLLPEHESYAMLCPKMIVDGYYVETNNNTQAKINKLRSILEVYGLSDYLLLKINDGKK